MFVRGYCNSVNYGLTSSECLCYTSTTTFTCSEYDLANGDDCSNVTGTYLHLLSTSTAFCSACAVALSYSICTCMGVCCGASKPANGGEPVPMTIASSGDVQIPPTKAYGQVAKDQV